MMIMMMMTRVFAAAAVAVAAVTRVVQVAPGQRHRHHRVEGDAAVVGVRGVLGDAPLPPEEHLVLLHRRRPVHHPMGRRRGLDEPVRHRGIQVLVSGGRVRPRAVPLFAILVEHAHPVSVRVGVPGLVFSGVMTRVFLTLCRLATIFTDGNELQKHHSMMLAGPKNVIWTHID